MKTVLCFGDSNTWGYNPVTGERHKYEDRWTTILQEKLGSGYLIIPEGLNGRTTVWEDPIDGHKNGSTYLPPCLESHKPLDLVIIMLGTNDLKARFSLPACDIAAGAGVLIDIVQKSTSGLQGSAPDILLLIPPEIRKLSAYKAIFEGGKKVSKEFSREFSLVAEEKGVPFMNIGDTVRFSDADGIHFEPDQLLILAGMVADKVRLLME